MKTINQESMRNRNKNIILEYIQKSGPVTKAEISTILGLSSTSVATFINELTAETKIIHCGAAKSTGGRKSALYQLNPDSCLFLGIDLQVDRIIGILMNFCGETILSTEYRFDNKDEWSVSENLSRLIQTIAQQKNIPYTKITGIGIGVPGIVNSAELIELAPNLGWKNVNLKELLSINVPLLIENEANAALWGEKSFGAARRAINTVYVSVGMGIGCGLLLNGRLYTGHTSHAGEFGHMTIEPEDGLPCQCGNHGCWEAYASNKAALKIYTEKTGQALGSYEEFITLTRHGDPHALATLEFTVKYLGIGIANIVNSINPEMVIIGGKITELQDIIARPLLKQIKESSLDKTFSGLTFRFASLKDQACAMGVAGLFIEKTITDL
jgi:predicted NBD/HSP70 family sugar kinase